MRRPKVQISEEPHEHEGYLIRELYHLLKARIETRMRDAEIAIGFPQAQVLHELLHEPGLSSAQQARRSGTTAQSMSGVIAALEQQGIIERRPHPENARVMQCYVSEDGLGCVRRARPIADRVIEQMLEALPAEERGRFRASLRQCIDALEQIPLARGE